MGSLESAGTAELAKLGEAWCALAPSTVARRSAALRRFYGFLLDEGMRRDDPSAALPKPRLQRPLPSIIDSDEVEAMLKRHNVGRLAFTFRDRVDIEPIHFVYADGAMYGRTAPGSKLSTLLHHPWVALEIDEVDDLFDWRSVVVKGTVYVVEPDDSAAVADHYERAVEAIRTLVPEAFTENDPAPSRSIVFRLHVHEKQGRAAKPNG